MLKAGVGALGYIAGSGQPQDAKEPVSQEEPQQPGGFENFLQKHPELGAFLQKELQSGLQPSDAVMRAKAVKKFRNQIEDIENDIGQPLEAIIGQLFGASQKQKKQESPAMSEFMAALQEYKNLTQGR